MENIFSSEKVKRELFAYRVIDIHDDDIGFAQNNFIYVYTTDSNSKTKGVPWLRMQSTGETGKNRRKYFLFLADETEPCAFVDKHNDVYDFNHNYIVSLVKNKFILFILLFMMCIIMLAGLAMYLGSVIIINTAPPSYEKQIINIDSPNEKDSDNFRYLNLDVFDALNEKIKKYPGYTGESKYITEYKEEIDGRLNYDKEKKYIVYPGISDEFVFYIQNKNKDTLKYTLGFMESNPEKIPLKFKVFIDDKSITDDKWIDSLSDCSLTSYIKSDNIIKCRVLWQWPDDRIKDARDTDLGVRSGVNTITYQLKAVVYFENTEN